MSVVEHGIRYAESPLSGKVYRVTAWEEKDDGKIVAHEKEEIDIEEVPKDKLCDYCGAYLAVEWSDQGKRQCRKCSPNAATEGK